MPYKFFAYLLLTIALLITAPCFAMELTADDISRAKKVRFSQQLSIESIEEVFSLESEIDKRQAAFDSMEPTREKSKLAKREIEWLESCMVAVKTFVPQEDFETLKLMQTQFLKSLKETIELHIVHRHEERARILLQQAEVDITAASHLKPLRKASAHLKKAYHKSKGKMALKWLEELKGILFALGRGCCLVAKNETDPLQKISTYSEGLGSFKECFRIAPLSELPLGYKELWREKLDMALLDVIALHANMTTSTQIFQEPESSIKYKNLIKNVEILKNILIFLEKYLMDPELPFVWMLVRDNSSDQMAQKISKKPSGSQNRPSLIDQENYLSLLYNTYCGMLKGASKTVVELPAINPALAAVYQRRGQEHLDLAFNIYKEKVYKGEYAHEPGKENAFILARLE